MDVGADDGNAVLLARNGPWAHWFRQSLAGDADFSHYLPCAPTVFHALPQCAVSSLILPWARTFCRGIAHSAVVLLSLPWARTFSS